MNQQLLARYYILLAIFVIGFVFFGIIAIRYIKNRSKRSSEISLIWVTVIEKVLVYGIPILLLFYAIRFASDLPYVIKGDYATKTGVITEKSMNDIKIDGKWYSIYGECWYGEGNTVTIDFLPHTKFAEISSVKTINHKVRKMNNKIYYSFQDKKQFNDNMILYSYLCYFKSAINSIKHNELFKYMNTVY